MFRLGRQFRLFLRIDVSGYRLESRKVNAMSRRLRPVLCMLLLCISSSVLGAANQEIPWAQDVESAFQEAKARNLPVLLHFWSPDCVPCRRLEQTVFNQQRVIQSMNELFVPVQVNAKEYPAVARRYGIRSVPKDVIVTPMDEEIHRMFTPANADQYVAQLTAVAFRTGKTSGHSFAGPSSPFGGERKAQRSSLVDRQADRSQFAQRSPLTEKYDQRNPEPVISSADRRNDGPQEVLNKFAGRRSSPANAFVDPEKESPNIDADDSHQGRSRWGSWPNHSDERSERTNSGIPAKKTITNHTTRNGWRTENSTPDKPTAKSSTQSAPPKVATQQSATVGLEGYCPVTLLKKNKWVKGDRRYGVVHRGRAYLFTGLAEKEMFFADPDEFSPVLAGLDPVALSENGKANQGRRAHGVVYRQRVYLFSSEDNLSRFWEEPERFATPIRQAMEAGDLNRLFR